jgi:glycerol-3-phosphate cytidylyltransferase
MRTVVTLGTFDLFHAGHVRLLERCAGIGQRVVVGLNTDEFVTRYKGRPPVVAYEDRAAVLRACRYVDGVLPNDQADGSAADVIERSGADAIVVGSDWQGRDYLGQLGITDDWVRARGIGILYLPYTEGISTTRIRAGMAATA